MRKIRLGRINCVCTICNKGKLIRLVSTNFKGYLICTECNNGNSIVKEVDNLD